MFYQVWILSQINIKSKMNTLKVAVSVEVMSLRLLFKYISIGYWCGYENAFKPSAATHQIAVLDKKASAGVPYSRIFFMKSSTYTRM